MNYRYFYNSQGRIIGFSEYRTQCLVASVIKSIGYIDSEEKINIKDYHIDLTTLTLTPNT